MRLSQIHIIDAEGHVLSDQWVETSREGGAQATTLGSSQPLHLIFVSFVPFVRLVAVRASARVVAQVSCGRTAREA
jgi:hypothetical protein